MEQITLYYRQGGSDKVYQASIQPKDNGYVVNFSYGRRGSAQQTGTKTPVAVSYEAAKVSGSHSLQHPIPGVLGLAERSGA